MSYFRFAILLIIAIEAANGAILLWSSKEIQIPVLRRFDKDDLYDLLKAVDGGEIIAFKSTTSSAAHNINKLLSNLSTTYIISNSKIEIENAKELTGHESNDINIINDALKKSQNENCSNVVALIINDAERMKRKVEPITPVPSAIVSTTELLYTEPSGDPVLYSAALPMSNDAEAMIYSSRPPLLKINTTSINLGAATIANVDVRDTYTRLIATILVENSKIYLRFKFPWVNGYWYLTSVEVEFVGEHAKQFNLTLNQDVTAPRRFSYHCGGQIVFSDVENDIELYIFEVQAQPDAYRHRFGDAYNCVPFTTGPLWSGLFVTFVLVIGLAVGLTALGSIKTMDKFDTHKTKQLSITVWE